MRIRPLIAVLPAVLGLLALAISAAQQPVTEPRSKPLETRTTPVRLVLGIGDEKPEDWSGRLTVDRGEVVEVEGVRFRAGDEVTGRGSWKATSRRVRKGTVPKQEPARGSAAEKPAVPRPTGPSTYGRTVVPNAVVVSLKDATGSTLAVETAQGRFAVLLDRLTDGAAISLLNDRVRAQRAYAHAPLFEGPLQQDFPAAASEAAGARVWVVAVWHEPRGPELLPAVTERLTRFADSAPTDGGDQLRLIPVLLEGSVATPGAPLDVTEPGRDLWRPAVATAGDGSVHIVWTEKRGENWDLFSRRYDPKSGTFAAQERLTLDPGPDSDAVLATAADGAVWLAWQAWRRGQADIFLAPLDGSAKLAGPPVKISDTPVNEWAPAIAADRSGRVHVAFDSYEAGNYDVVLRTREADGGFGPPVRVAATPAYEARPSLAADSRGRLWVAYEERAPHWGKDAVNLLDGKGSSLYRASKVVVAVVDGGRVLRAPDPVERAPALLQVMNSYPRLTIDRSGRPWLLYRHRQEFIWGDNAAFVVGAIWSSHATTLSGPAWSPPVPLTRSDGLLDTRPALAQCGDGPVLAIYATDGRLRREVEMEPGAALTHFSNQGTPPGVHNVDLEMSGLVASSRAEEPQLRPAPVAGVPEESVHPNEAGDLGRIRAYRVQAGGKSYRLLRGEFHRHTEISADGGSDGSLEDMWRYALDAASLDWIGNGDHDSGGGKEYTWWLIQKTTDLYSLPPTFVPMFTYERSVAYPRGHRNVMFDHRGVRTLPRLIGADSVQDADTLMLYDYLKEHNGICASHTSGTGMGTDWRDVDDSFEPFVEIYQGHRQSYEYLGAPRSARRKAESIGGWQPLGFIWNALAMQYRLGFQASSDHISTHISYAIALAEDATRRAILDAFRSRHCYAATDNIILDVRSGEHLMGDEFDAPGPVRLDVYIHGTSAVSRVDIIKDFKYVYSTEPRTAQVAFAWTDDERDRPPGLSWYYVRAIQDNGELAWASPLWVHTR
jgi:hypothetical protein